MKKQKSFLLAHPSILEMLYNDNLGALRFLRQNPFVGEKIQLNPYEERTYRELASY